MCMPSFLKDPTLSKGQLLCLIKNNGCQPIKLKSHEYNQHASGGLCLGDVKGKHISRADYKSLAVCVLCHTSMFRCIRNARLVQGINMHSHIKPISTCSFERPEIDTADPVLPRFRKPSQMRLQLLLKPDVLYSATHRATGERSNASLLS